MTSSPASRRGFLRQLATLPLIGGGIALIGRPTAAAEPVTLDLMEAYKTWLHYEGDAIAFEIAQAPEIKAFYAGLDGKQRYKLTRSYFNHIGQAGPYHWYPDMRLASSRAALVLSAVGCDWREDRA